MAVKLVDGKGRVRSFHTDDPELAAIRACVGLCGVIYQITLRVYCKRNAGMALYISNRRASREYRSRGRALLGVLTQRSPTSGGCRAERPAVLLCTLLYLTEKALSCGPTDSHHQRQKSIGLPLAGL